MPGLFVVRNYSQNFTFSQSCNDATPRGSGYIEGSRGYPLKYSKNEKDLSLSPLPEHCKNVSPNIYV